MSRHVAACRCPWRGVLLVEGKVQLGQVVVPALIPVWPLPVRLLPPGRFAAKQDRGDLCPASPQPIPLSGLRNDDQVQVGLFVGSSLRDRAVNDGSTHGSISSGPYRGSRGHLLSRKSHRAALAGHMALIYGSSGASSTPWSASAASGPDTSDSSSTRHTSVISTMPTRPTSPTTGKCRKRLVVMTLAASRMLVVVLTTVGLAVIT